MKLFAAGPEWAEACVPLFDHCAIHDRYFQDSGRLENTLLRAAETGELFAVQAEDGALMGAMCIMPRGFCGLYPYLKLIGVGEQFRGKGVGAFLMQEFERMAREQGARKTSLMVSDFNTDAQRFYRRLGYVTLGTIPDASKSGIGELVLLKDL